MIDIKALGTTIITIGGLIGFQLYGAPLLVIMWLVTIMIGLCDVFLGRYIAYQHKITTSSISRNGLIAKFGIWILSGLLVMLISIASWMINSEAFDKIAATIAWIVMGFAFSTEVLSIVENMIIIVPEGRNKSLLKFFAKVLGIGYEFAQEKLEKNVRSATGGKSLSEVQESRGQ